MVEPGQALFEVSLEDSVAERFVSLHDAQAWAKQQLHTREEVVTVLIVRGRVIDPVGKGHRHDFEFQRGLIEMSDQPLKSFIAVW